MLQQVILNLVMNAIESMSSAEPRVLSIKSEITAQNGIRVSIADTGSGISITNLNRVFTPMFTTKARGMGMGLSICKSIIESHNGRIWVTAGALEVRFFNLNYQPTALSINSRCCVNLFVKAEHVLDGIHDSRFAVVVAI